VVIISLGVSVHHFSSWNIFNRIVEASIDISASRINLWRKNRLGLSKNSLFSKIFPLILKKILPIHAKVLEFPIDQMNLMISQTKGLPVYKSFEN
jgi:hypothetical protein